MGVLVQVRDVPEEVHRTLKARAAREGVSISEYLRTELQRVAESPTPDELLGRLRSRQAVGQLRAAPEPCEPFALSGLDRR